MQELLESYLNGNISYVRNYLKESATFSLGEFFDFFVNDSGYCPSTDEMVMFVKRLES